MVSFLLVVSCTGHRFAQPPLTVAVCEPWSTYLASPPDGDRIVACHDRDLAVQSSRSVADALAHWTAVLTQAGLAPLHDDSRGPVLDDGQPMIAMTWGDPSPRVALAISHDGVTHVSLARLP